MSPLIRSVGLRRGGSFTPPEPGEVVLATFDFESDAVDTGAPDGWSHFANNNTPPTYGVTNTTPISGSKSMYSSGGSGGVYLTVDDINVADVRLEVKVRLAGSFESLQFYLRWAGTGKRVMYRFSTHSAYYGIEPWNSGAAGTAVSSSSPVPSENAVYRLVMEAKGADCAYRVYDTSDNLVQELTTTTTLLDSGGVAIFMDGAPVNSRVDDVVITAL